MFKLIKNKVDLKLLPTKNPFSFEILETNSQIIFYLFFFIFLSLKYGKYFVFNKIVNTLFLYLTTCSFEHT